MLLALAGASLLAVGAALAAPSYVIQADVNIGGFKVKRDGTLGGATGVLGRPTSKRLKGHVCHVGWRSFGVRMTFYNLGGQPACSDSTGYFGSATVTGRLWRTSVGLRVGDGVTRLRRLYPSAAYPAGSGFPSGWWLVPRFTQATGRYPGLLARVQRGRVSALEVYYQAGGE